MALFDPSNQVVRLGFATNYQAFTASEELELNNANNTRTLVLTIPRQLAVPSITYQCHVVGASQDRFCRCILTKGAIEIARYAFNSGAAGIAFPIADNNISLVSTGFPGDLYTWTLEHTGAALTGGNFIRVRMVISVQGTPI